MNKDAYRKLEVDRHQKVWLYLLYVAARFSGLHAPLPGVCLVLLWRLVAVCCCCGAFRSVWWSRSQALR